MSFFGSDGLDHQLRNLKALVSAKDAELNSLRNELNKKADVANGEKQAKEDALFQLNKEAERAEKAEKALTSRNNEITTLRSQLFNLESSLKSSNEKLAKEEKEKERLQYASSDNSSDRIRKLQDDHTALQTKVKDLEGVLRKKESEVNELRTEGSSWGSQGTSRSDRAKLLVLQNECAELRNENARLKTAVPLPSTPRLSKSSTSNNFFAESPLQAKSRRASLAPSDNRVAELEAEIQALRNGQGSSDSDALRSKLTSAISARDKLENQKLALEKSTKREIGELKERVEELTDEVNYYRFNGADSKGSSKEEVEKLKKESSARIGALEEKIHQKTKEIEQLEKKVATIADLQAELEDLRAMPSPTPSLDAVPGLDSQIVQLNEKVATLESDLAAAKQSTSSSGISSSTAITKQIRQLQRDLDTVKRERDSLKDAVEESDDIIAQKDEELFRLKSAIPVPGSPSLSAVIPADTSRLIELEDRIRALELEKQALQDQLRSAQDASGEQEEKMVGFTTDLVQAKADLVDLESQLTSLRTELAAASDTRMELERNLEGKNKALVAAEAEVQAAKISLEASKEALIEIEQLRQALDGKDQEASTAVQRVQELEAGRAKLEAELRDDQEKLIELKSGLQSLEAANMANEQSQREVSASLAQAQQDFESSQTCLREEEATCAALRIELESARSHVEAKQSKFDALQEEYRQAGVRLAEMQSRLVEMEDCMADRSTASEARVKDEELFELKESLETLTQQMELLKQDHQGEVDSATFLREQDKLEYNTKSAELVERIEHLEAQLRSTEQELASSKSTLEATYNQLARLTQLPSTPHKNLTELDNEKHLALMHSKIEKLRSERDELRQNLSYLAHENRFALRAAVADKQSAAEETAELRIELQTKLESCERLQGEVTEVQERLVQINGTLSDVEASFASASCDKHDLVDKVAQLESDLDKIRKERDEMEESTRGLVSNLTWSKSRVQKLEKELAESARNEKQLEQRMDQLKSERATASDHRAEDEEEGSKSRTVSAPANLDSDRWQSEVADWKARVGRRDLVIEESQRMLSRAKANEAMAKETIMEKDDEIEEMTTQLVLLQRVIESKETTFATTAQSNTLLQTQLETSSTRISDLEQEIEFTKSNLATTTSQVVDLDKARHTLQAELQRYRDQESILREEISSHKLEVKALSARIVDMQMSQDRLQAELSRAEKRESETLNQLAEARGTYIGLQETAKADKDSHLIEQGNLLKRLETQRVESETKTNGLELEVSELMEKISAIEKKRTEAQQVSSSEADAIKSKIALLEVELVERENNVKRLEGEMEALIADLAGADEAHGEALKASNEEMERYKVTMESEKSSLEAKCDDLQRVVKSKVDEIARLQHEMEEGQTALDLARAKATSTAKEADERESRIAELQRQLSGLETTSASASDSISTLTTQISALQSTLAATEEERDVVKKEMGDARSASATMQSRLDDVSNELEAATELKTHLEDLVKGLKEDMERSDKMSKQHANLAKFHENEAKSQSKAMKLLQEQLTVAQKDASSASSKYRVAQEQLDSLVAENDKLKIELASKPSASSAEVEALTEEIQQLEAQLKKQNEEVDEADDRVKEAYIAKRKLERKVEKLTRQLANKEVESQTALNTALNAKLAAAPALSVEASSASTSVPIGAPIAALAPPAAISTPRATSMAPPAPRSATNVFASTKSDMPPPPAPNAATRTPSAQITSSPPRPSSRPALRTVNIFDRSQIPSTPSDTAQTIGAKRMREEQVDQKPLTEAIMQPPSATRPAMGLKTTKENTVPMMTPRGGRDENIFSKTPTSFKSNLTRPAQSPFTRNAFSTDR